MIRMLILLALAAAPTFAAYTAPGVDWVEVTRQVREEYAAARWLNATHLVRRLAERADELDVNKEELAKNFRVFLSLVILSPGERRALALERHSDTSDLLPASLYTTEELLEHLSTNFPNHYAVLKRRLDVGTAIVEEKLGVEAKEFVRTFATKHAFAITKSLVSRVAHTEEDKLAKKQLNDEFTAAYGSLSAACQRELERVFPLATLREVAGKAAGPFGGGEEPTCKSQDYGNHLFTSSLSYPRKCLTITFSPDTPSPIPTALIEVVSRSDAALYSQCGFESRGCDDLSSNSFRRQTPPLSSQISVEARRNSMNMTVEETHIAETQTVYLCVLAIVIGITSIVLKTLSIALFCLSKDLRQKYLLFMALDFGEIINGVAFTVTGIGRASLLESDQLFSPIIVSECILTKPWPILLIIGAQLPAAITVFISVERVIAVQFPAIFVKIHSNRSKSLYILVSLVFQAVSIGVAVASSASDTEEWASQHCPIVSSTNKFYSTFHFVFVFLAYVVSFLSLLVVASVQSQLKVSEQVKRETKMSLYLATTGSAILFVAIPAVMMLAIRWHLFEVGDIISSAAYLLPGVTAIGTTVTNLIFRRDYRSQLKSLVRLNFSSLHRQMEPNQAFTYASKNTHNTTIATSRVI